MTHREFWEIWERFGPAGDSVRLGIEQARRNEGTTVTDADLAAWAHSMAGTDNEGMVDK